MTTPNDIRAQVQKSLDELGDNEKTLAETMQTLNYYHGVSAMLHVRTTDNAYWLLCRDINELIQELRT